MNKLRVIKWWWAWNYEKVEKWLEQMEKSGYRLTKITPGGIAFHFEKDYLSLWPQILLCLNGFT